MPDPTDGGPALGGDEAIPIPGDMTFEEFIAGLNPLHHIPVVGPIYRLVTGEEINPGLKAIGAGIAGMSPMSMIMTGVVEAIKMSQPMDRIRLALNGQPDPVLEGPSRPQQVYANANEAYRRWGEMGRVNLVA